MIINMTPHAINIVDANGLLLQVIPASGNTIRLTQQTVVCGAIDNVPVSKTVYGDAVGMPEQVDGTFYVVSQLVKTAFPGRTDLLVPAQLVRDANGNIVGCMSLGV